MVSVDATFNKFRWKSA